MRVGLLSLALACAIPHAHGHDLISVEAAEKYLAESGRLLKTIASAQPPAQRAQAHVALGRMLDDIRDLLNRDLATHGRVQGLPTNYLLAEFRSRGLEFQLAAAGNRFLASPHYYREALRLDPQGARADDALLGLLRGHFYDSFSSDPLRPSGQTWALLVEQIRIGETFLKAYPRHAEREEAAFIVLIHYVQASRAAGDSGIAEQFSEKARSAIAEFAARYSGSMRAAALQVLLEGLPRLK